jgi:polysaccharide pyruvyl transferase WcaK-like protein
LVEYDASSVRRRHMAFVRDYVGVSAWCEAAQTVMIDACRQAAKTRDDLADIVNIALEELVRQRYELPAFNTVLRAARAARTEINQGYYAQVRERLSDTALRAVNALLARPPETVVSS